MATVMQVPARTPQLIVPHKCCHLLERLAWYRDVILNYIAPMGYEDETGFHYGTPAPRCQSALRMPFPVEEAI